MKKILAILLLAASSAFAQAPSPAMVQGFVAELEAQVRAANTRSAQLAGQLSEEQEKSKAKDAEVERLKKLCGDACKPKDEAKK